MYFHVQIQRNIKQHSQYFVPTSAGMSEFQLMCVTMVTEIIVFKNQQ